MSTFATTLKTTTGMANFNASNGYLVAKGIELKGGGIEFPDGTTQSTAYPSIINPSLQVNFASDALQATSGTNNAAPVTTTFLSPYEDTSGGLYMMEVRGAIGGGSTAWTGTAADNETITVRIQVQLNASSGGITSFNCGYVGTITKSFGLTQLPSIGYQTQFVLPALAAGENWPSATLNFGMASSNPASTSTIQRTSFVVYLYKLS